MVVLPKSARVLVWGKVGNRLRRGFGWTIMGRDVMGMMGEVVVEIGQ